MDRFLTDGQWARVAPHTAGKRGDRGQTGRDTRLFVDAALWMAREGARWRALPAGYGHWNSVFIRFRRWARLGVWERVFQALQGGPDFECVLVDSTVVRAHQHSAGGQGGAAAQAMGRSRGGLSSKLHLATDALGNPLRLLLTPGQAHESKVLPDLPAGLAPEAVVGDSAFDGSPSRDCIAAHGAKAVVPSSPSRSRRVPHDRALYRERNLVERCFQKLKQFRRVATRHDKTAASFLAFATLAACTILWK